MYFNYVKLILIIFLLHISNNKVFSSTIFPDSSAFDFFKKGEEHILNGDTLKAIKAFKKSISKDRKIGRASCRERV